MKRGIESVLNEKVHSSALHEQTADEQQQSKSTAKHKSRANKQQSATSASRLLAVQSQELLADLNAQRTRLVSLLCGRSPSQQSQQQNTNALETGPAAADAAALLDRQLHALLQSLLISNAQHEIVFKRVAAAFGDDSMHIEWDRCRTRSHPYFTVQSLVHELSNAARILVLTKRIHVPLSPVAELFGSSGTRQ